MDKSALRKALLKQRGTAHRTERESALETQAAWLRTLLKPEHVLGAYNPIRSERDPGPLLSMLEHGTMAFPKVPGPAQALIFYQTKDAQDFAEGAFGVMEPLDTLPIVQPHVVLAPMVGFDAAGYRIGYGGGFYDRTLSHLSSTNIGFAYDGQLSDHALNFEPTDFALDYIMTPTRLYDFTRNTAEVRPWA